jgi:ABC-2 type transport system permease protein
MGVYVIVTGNKLISQLVDKGTMAYVLSNPVKRTAVAFTQAVFFAGSLFFMFAIGAAAHIVSAYFAKGISAADAGLVIKLSLGLFVLSIAFSGIMFCASSIFNLSKHTTAVGGGLVGLFLLIPMVSMFGDNFKWLKYISLQSLYNPLGIVSDTDDFVWKFIVLAVVGIALYIAGSSVFAKRDLPL